MFYCQNLTDGQLPLWYHGRCRWNQWGLEWLLAFDRYHLFSIGFRKGGYHYNNIILNFSLIFFTIYISREFKCDFKDRMLGVYWYEGGLWLNLWVDDEYHSHRPWWRNTIHLPIKQWIIGRAKFKCIEGETIDVLVPMPEGCYTAKCTREDCSWSYRFGYKIARTNYNLDIDKGIPFEGKGENSWDCGEDRLHGISGETPEKAIGNAVASVLRSRNRYGGIREPKMVIT